MKESELFAPVKEFLLENGCSDVYGEVLDCDVLGINGACNIIVELKKTLSFKLIDQAIERLSYGHYVYIAIPNRKGPLPRCVKRILEENKIGLLMYKEMHGELYKEMYGEGFMHVEIPARFNRLTIRNQYSIRKFIREYHKDQVGGVKGGEGKTDYSVMIDSIKDFLAYRKRGQWVTIEEILNSCEVYYAKPKPSLIATLQATWNRGWCETKVENKQRYFRLKSEKIFGIVQ
ncbi:hypothetical protein [Fictibacillus sp. NRS-1165]|uniref:hypothetical protein n=1 Tax=Fictibacillus sp. NRS-1165 TaxID=3144463 RepID=UPI003D216D67